MIAGSTTALSVGGSSTAEHSTVNRRVVGSNPTPRAGTEEPPAGRLFAFRRQRSPCPDECCGKDLHAVGPLTLKFSSAGTADPDGDPVAYAWDFDADGKVDSGEPSPTHVYDKNGTYRATLRVTDRTGRSAGAEVLVLVGNAAPKVELITTPPAEGPFQFGDTVTYEVKVTDDTPVDCSKVSVAFVLGHETHGHPPSSTAGCTGSIKTFLDGGHAGAANLSAVFVASYTDPGEDGTPGPTGSAQVRIVRQRGPDADAYSAGAVVARSVAAQRSSWVAAVTGPG
jgi:cytochrome c